LMRGSNAEVILLEAGPDYGHFDELNWPAELLDTRRIPATHDMGLMNRDPNGRSYPLERAQVIGGCSAHNGCSAVRGARQDFIAWEHSTGGRFSTAGLEQDFQDIETLLRVRSWLPGELSPYQEAVRDAALRAGWPESLNINDLDENEGVSVCPVNKRGSMRWNAAFAFVDPFRNNQRLRIVGNAEVRRLLMKSGRPVGVEGLLNGEPFCVRADVVVLAAGAYMTPIILQRSGIGDPPVLQAAGIECLHALKGVGRNLQDHPCTVLRFDGSPALVEAMRKHRAQRQQFEEGIIIKRRSTADVALFDLHLFPVGSEQPPDSGTWTWDLYVGLMREYSRGSVLVDAGGMGHTFTIAHQHFTDSGQNDLDAMEAGIEIARGLFCLPQLKALARTETHPGSNVTGVDLRAWIRANHVHYWHPAGSCAMGTDVAKGAVCDGNGAILGVDNLYVADASLMPTITSNNINLPVALLGWRVGRSLASRLNDEI
ncbi:MAG: GMC family oxidoreductase, partial [Burkholderiaceae bacterium]